MTTLMAMSLVMFVMTVVSLGRFVAFLLVMMVTTIVLLLCAVMTLEMKSAKISYKSSELYKTELTHAIVTRKYIISINNNLMVSCMQGTLLLVATLFALVFLVPSAVFLASSVLVVLVVKIVLLLILVL